MSLPLPGPSTRNMLIEVIEVQIMSTLTAPITAEHGDVDPPNQTIDVHRAPDELREEPALPGFTLKPDECFAAI